MQELVEVVGRATGVVLMAPPVEHAEAAASISTLLSSLKPKQKVWAQHPVSWALLALVVSPVCCCCKHELVPRAPDALAALCKARPLRMCLPDVSLHLVCVDCGCGELWRQGRAC